MASRSEAAYGVWLYNDRIGTLNQRGDFTWFEFNESYRANTDRSVLGLWFENKLSDRHSKHMRVHPWFSNLLLEGRLREWIADGRGVSADREMELLAQVGHDLPGAVRVLPEDTVPGATPAGDPTSPDDRRPTAVTWRFSLAGVQLKFSMLQQGDRLTIPASGIGGDWIVKLPDKLHPEVPRNEHAMMRLAAAAGIEVPECRLVHRDELPALPDGAWPPNEEWAFAVRRFDRDPNRGLIHIEDLAQVRGFWPDDKYRGSYESVAALVYRRHDVAALREFARRLAFDILISNGDAHLKNWSLIYRNHRIPTLAPAYDLVSTEVYRERNDPETLGLRFHGTHRFDKITFGSFTRLEHKLVAPDAELRHHVMELVTRVHEAWPEISDSLSETPFLNEAIHQSIVGRTATLIAG